MIFQKEIAEKAQEWEVPATTVDKDYVLGHFLNCFINFENNKNLFVFKGGTCLRKCYFPNYRFSEDLDFTLLDASFIVNEDFFQKITKVCTQKSGILFHLTKFEKKRFLDNEKGYKCVIAFWGANHNKNIAPAPQERWTTKIEIDISFDEEILFPIDQKRINHAYSDFNLISEDPVPVYKLEEILTEKIRAFYQRSYKAPRDFYDVWYLLINHSFGDWNKIRETLRKKCELKNKNIDTEIFNDARVYQTVSKSWNQSIEHHLPAKQLPEFEEIWSFLKEHLFKQFINI